MLASAKTVAPVLLTGCNRVSAENVASRISPTSLSPDIFVSAIPCAESPFTVIVSLPRFCAAKYDFVKFFSNRSIFAASFGLSVFVALRSNAFPSK